MSNFEQRLDQYADLLIRVGINLQPGQKLIVRGSLEHADLVRRAVAKAYEAGAGRVFVDWTDPQVRRMTAERATEDGLKEYPPSWLKWQEELLAGGGALLSVTGSDPQLLAGIEPGRVSAMLQAAARVNQGVSALTATMQASWCVGAAPVQGWANAALPDLPESERVAALWDRVFTACRIDGVTDPVPAWRVHLGRLGERTDFLNRMQFTRLHYRAPGTELTVGLPANHLWFSGAGSRNSQGVPFCPNLPTEEVFTAPQRDAVDGVVRSTLPLNHGGALITGLTLRFERGRVVEYSADSGVEVLKGILETDEGARFLGEVALVPVSSPINQTGILFYNTLFDENASCHLAVGRAYPFCVQGGTAMSAAEREQAGLNFSNTHVDFVIGSAELDIDGETASGERVPLFRRGMWV
ncbi:MAG: aminopeptidase [Bacillota bacterium]